jgi:hypothetical protein
VVAVCLLRFLLVLLLLGLLRAFRFVVLVRVRGVRWRWLLGWAFRFWWFCLFLFVLLVVLFLLLWLCRLAFRAWVLLPVAVRCGLRFSLLCWLSCLLGSLLLGSLLVLAWSIRFGFACLIVACLVWLLLVICWFLVAWFLVACLVFVRSILFGRLLGSWSVCWFSRSVLLILFGSVLVGDGLVLLGRFSFFLFCRSVCSIMLIFSVGFSVLFGRFFLFGGGFDASFFGRFSVGFFSFFGFFFGRFLKVGQSLF